MISGLDILKEIMVKEFDGFSDHSVSATTSRSLSRLPIILYFIQPFPIYYQGRMFPVTFSMHEEGNGGQLERLSHHHFQLPNLKW